MDALDSVHRIVWQLRNANADPNMCLWCMRVRLAQNLPRNNILQFFRVLHLKLLNLKKLKPSHFGVVRLMNTIRDSESVHSSA